MKLRQEVIAKLAEHLETCELEARDTTKITDEYPDMDWDDAYAIQDEIRRRKVARGCKIVGGLTRNASQIRTQQFLLWYSILVHVNQQTDVAGVPGCHRFIKFNRNLKHVFI